MVGQLIRQHIPPQAKEAIPASLRAIQKLQDIEISSQMERSHLEETRKILRAKLREIDELLAEK